MIVQRIGRGLHTVATGVKLSKPLFAVIKVGGEVVSTPKSLTALTTSLCKLNEFGLNAIVVHGGGPQLNDELAAKNIKPEYVDGNRVTNLEIMNIAAQLFPKINHQLCTSLGPIAQGFTADLLLAKKKSGFVGEIIGLNAPQLIESLNNNKIPVIASLANNVDFDGDENDSKVLNINADVAAREISLSLKSLKTVFVSARGGWFENDEFIPEINLEEKYDQLISQDYTGRQGTKLKLMEINHILENLPSKSTVSICSAENLNTCLLGSQSTKNSKTFSKFFSSSLKSENKKKIGLIGARGYTGQELLKIVANHNHMELVFASSRQLEGQKVDIIPNNVLYSNLNPEHVVSTTNDLDIDCWVLALPNGLSHAFSKNIEEGKFNKQITVLDLSADNRFDSTWIYGMVEGYQTRSKYLDLAATNVIKISNPGCYATGTQLALLPLAGKLRSPPSVFGVSGYSGAGTTPGLMNDQEFLKDNLIAYKKIGHIHEKECSFHLGSPIHFTPHVSSFFRGITLTIQCDLERLETGEYPSAAHVGELFEKFYEGEPLVSVQSSSSVPLNLHQIQESHGVIIGGFEVCTETGRVVFVSLIDNLLKGAATQAIQNMNLALGLDEFEGILKK